MTYSLMGSVIYTFGQNKDWKSTMSEVIQSLAANGHPNLPPEIQEVYVQELINTLKKVASAEPNRKYSALPILFKDNIDLALILTDAKLSGARVFPDSRRIEYYLGRYEKQFIEFAQHYARPEAGGETVGLGVRRQQSEERRSSQRAALKLPTAAMDTFVSETLEGIREIPDISENI